MGSARELLKRLALEFGHDPSSYPALAEALRRVGQLREAEQVARDGLGGDPDPCAGGMALSLSLIDQGRLNEARQVLLDGLASALGLPPADDSEQETDPAGHAVGGAAESDFGRSLTDEELEGAFDDAEPERDEMIDLDRVAEAVLRRADPSPGEAIGAVPDSVFATETVAELLERQGDTRGASGVREAIRARQPEAQGARGGGPARARAAGSGRRDRIETLEHWLANLQKGRP